MSPRQPVRTGAAGLSARQREALRLLCADVPPKLIARELGISDRMLRRHLVEACRRLGADSIAAAAYRFGQEQ